MQILFTIIISFLTATGAFVASYKYMPLSFIDDIQKEPMFGGVTLTDLVGTNTLNTFPTTYNANNAIIEGQFDNINGTTTNTTITSLANLATIGTITTGVWNGTAIGVAKGGTGTTSPSLNQVILGNGSSGFKVVSGLGTLGQFLTSAGAGSPPTWTTGALDYTADYNWTGTTTIKNLHASSTSANPMYLNGIDYAMPSTEGASSTALMTNGSGSLSWNGIDWQLLDKVTTGVVATTSISGIPNRKFLRFVFYVPSKSLNTRFSSMTFNNDFGNNYGYSYTKVGAATGDNGGTNYIVLQDNTAGADEMFDIVVRNSATQRKTLYWNGVAGSASGNSAPDIINGSGVWNNTSDAISRVDFFLDLGAGAEYQAGTELIIYGSRD